MEEPYRKAACIILRAGKKFSELMKDFVLNPRLPWFIKGRLINGRREFTAWMTAMLRIIPGRIGSLLRCKFIPFQQIGKRVTLSRGFWAKYPRQLSIGDHTQINFDTYINAGGGVTIGSNVLIGPEVMIYSEKHNYRDSSNLIRKQDYVFAQVIIEDDVWLCARVMIMPGVRISRGTVVAAGAVVTKTTEPYSVVAGIPAVKIGERSVQTAADEQSTST